MSRTLTASDRSALIKLASTLPVGSDERKAILAGLGKFAGRDTAVRFDAKVSVSSAKPVGEGKGRLTGTVKATDGATHNTVDYDVVIEWRSFGPVVIDVRKGGGMTAFIVNAACHSSGPVQDALVSVL